MPPIVANVERFWSNVALSDDSDPGRCWLWFGPVGHNGYGLFSESRWRYRAHRLAYSLCVGPIPDGFYVCHRCDNPACVRPSHLFLGTAADNVRDMVSKSRNNPNRGRHNGRAKLTEAAVREIRAGYAAGGVTQAEIADRFGVSRSMVQFVLNRGNWKHVA